MDQLPLELISLIATKYLDDYIDKLAFIISSKAIWLAFIQCASSIDKYRLARQFDIDISDVDDDAVHEDHLDHPQRVRKFKKVQAKKLVQSSKSF